MVIGALFAAIHKEIDRYRDSKQEENDSLMKALILIEPSLDSTLLKIKLCKKEGDYMPKELQSCVPDITLEINEVAKATRDTFSGREIYDGLMDLAKGEIKVVEGATK